MSAIKPTFLGIPTELRYRIYELAFPSVLRDRQCTIQGSLSNIPGLQSSASSVEDLPWILMRTCRTVARELKDILPSVEEIDFTIEDLTPAELEAVIDYLGEQNVRRMRKLRLSGWATCYSRLFKDFHCLTGGGRDGTGLRPLEEHLRLGPKAHDNCESEMAPSDWHQRICLPGVPLGTAARCMCEGERVLWLNQAGFCNRAFDWDLASLREAAADSRLGEWERTKGRPCCEIVSRYGWLASDDCFERQRTILHALGRGLITSVDGRIAVDMNADQLRKMHALVADKSLGSATLCDRMEQVWDEYLRMRARERSMF